MNDDKIIRPTEPSGEDLSDRVSESKRQFLKVLLGGVTAYSAPLMASFSMEGLEIGSAEAWAQSYTCNQALDNPTAELDGDDLKVSFAAICEDSAEFEVRAWVTAVYACRNRGDMFPPGLEEEVETLVSTQAWLSGTIDATLTLNPPPRTRACPPGLEGVLVEIRYEDIEVENRTDGVTESASPSSLSAVFFP